MSKACKQEKGCSPQIYNTTACNASLLFLVTLAEPYILLVTLAEPYTLESIQLTPLYYFPVAVPAFAFNTIIFQRKRVPTVNLIFPLQASGTFIRVFKGLNPEVDLAKARLSVYHHKRKKSMKFSLS